MENMKKYFVDDRGLKWAFDTQENAEKKAAEIGGKVESTICWAYFGPYCNGRTGGTREITGKDLKSAIETNFDKILSDHDMSGLSGHVLHYVAVEKAEKGAELVIDLTKLGKMEKPGERISKRIQIEGVEPGDMDSEKVILFAK